MPVNATKLTKARRATRCRTVPGANGRNRRRFACLLAQILEGEIQLARGILLHALNADATGLSYGFKSSHDVTGQSGNVDLALPLQPLIQTDGRLRSPALNPSCNEPQLSLHDR